MTSFQVVDSSYLMNEKSAWVKLPFLSSTLGCFHSQVISMVALTRDEPQKDWMPASIMWCAISVTLLNPILLCLICQRYRKSYTKLGMCLAEACGRSDSSVTDTTVGKTSEGGRPIVLYWKLPNPILRGAYVATLLIRHCGRCGQRR